MADEVTSETPPRRGSNQGRLAVIGLGAAVVIAVIAVGGWWIATGGPAHKAGAAATVVAADPTPTPTAAPIPKKADPNQTFQSTSGNISCSIGLFAGKPGAICEQQKVNYAIPADACPSDQTSGVFVGVGADGGYWPCVGVWYNADQTLAYDTPITVNGITCTINLATGVKCVNKDGKGFTMEYKAGIAFI